MQYGFCDMFWSFGFKGRELNSYFPFSCFVYDIQLVKHWYVRNYYNVVPLIEDAISSLSPCYNMPAAAIGIISTYIIHPTAKLLIKYKRRFLEQIGAGPSFLQNHFFLESS